MTIGAPDIDSDSAEPLAVVDDSAPGAGAALAPLDAGAAGVFPRIGDSLGLGDDDVPTVLAAPVDPAARTTLDGVRLDQILLDRPDVLRAFYEEYYGPHNDTRSSAWDDRVGGSTPEDYANYWYNRFGRTEGYVPSTGAPDSPRGALEPSDGSAAIDADQILRDRPDVFRAYYEEYYGAHNDHHSHAWLDRVGGTTAQDYALYWYAKFGMYEGYGQGQGGAAAGASGVPDDGSGIAQAIDNMDKINAGIDPFDPHQAGATPGDPSDPVAPGTEDGAGIAEAIANMGKVLAGIDPFDPHQAGG